MTLKQAQGLNSKIHGEHLTRHNTCQVYSIILLPIPLPQGVQHYFVIHHNLDFD